MPVLSARGGRSAAAFGLGNGGFSPQALALFARMSTPPTGARKVAINRLYNDLISAGTLSKMDALYVFAAADSQAARLNWIASNSASEVSSPLFTADRGYSGNSGAGYLTGLTAASASRNNHHFAVWMRTAPASVGQMLWLNGTASSGILRVNPGEVGQMQSSSADPGTFASFTRTTGYIGVSRAGSGNYTRRDASTNTPVSAASVGFAGGTPSTMLANNVGSSIYDGQMSVAHYGSTLTGSELAATETALQTYLTSVGAYP